MSYSPRPNSYQGVGGLRSQPEQKLQRQVAEYLSWALVPPAWFTSIPAGGGGEMRGRILRGTGYRAGTPDLLIVYDGRAYFLELKSAKGVLSEIQRETHAVLKRAGCCVAVCRSLDDVRALFGPAGPWWPIPIRETKPSAERIRRGFMQPHALASDDPIWPESADLGRRRRKT